MDNAQREVAGILLDHIRSLGLISDFTYSKAMDLLYSGIELPAFFQYPVCPAMEAGGGEPAPPSADGL